MANLREMLLQEQQRLERILEKTSLQLKEVPRGTLQLSRTKGCVQYYHCILDGKKSKKYISKEDKELIRKLAQKTYDEKEGFGIRHGPGHAVDRDGMLRHPGRRQRRKDRAQRTGGGS